MLNYIITIAISAFFVPHYLSIFWEPLQDEPVGHRRRRGRDRRPRRAQHRRGQGGGEAQHRAGGRSTSRRRCCSSCSASRSSSTRTSSSTTSTGASRRRGANFALAIPVGDDRVHGDRDRLEPGRGGARPRARSIPRSITARRDRGLRDLLHAAADRALGAAGEDDRRAATDAARRCRRSRAASRTTRCSALVENLGLARRRCSTRSKIYVGMLAATILFIATNAGVIGASRITYSMASYRQLPEVFRRLHPRFKTPWLALVVFAGIALDRWSSCRARRDFLGTMYSFGAMLSFTVAHASIVRAARCGAGSSESRYRGAAEPAAPRRRLAAVRDRRRARDRDLLARRSSCRTPPRAGSGSAGSRSGFAVYVVYRRRVVRAPLTKTVQAPPAYRPGARARVPARARAGRAGAARRTRRSTSPAASRPSAARAIVGADRARGAARPAARRGAARARRSAPTDELDEARRDRRDVRRRRSIAAARARAAAPGRRSSTRRRGAAPRSS